MYFLGDRVGIQSKFRGLWLQQCQSSSVVNSEEFIFNEGLICCDCVWIEAVHRPALLCAVYVSYAISSFTLTVHHINFMAALSQIFSFTLSVYFHRHLPINSVRRENKSYFLAVTPSVLQNLCRKSTISPPHDYLVYIM